MPEFTPDCEDNDDDEDNLIKDGNWIFYTWFSPPEEICATSTVSQWLAEAYAWNSAPPDRDLPEWVQDFEDFFNRELFDSLLDRRLWDHTIKLVLDTKLANCKVHPISPLEQRELDTFIKEGLVTGQICPSKMASPVFFIKKKDRALWFVQDYRALNAMTVKTRYPLPLINNLIN